MRMFRSATATDDEVRTAIARVYETYGRDLNVFVDHVRDEMKRTQSDDLKDAPQENHESGDAARGF